MEKSTDIEAKMPHDKWAFTAWKEPVINVNMISYMIWQQELCPTTKLLHYQGYVEFKRNYKRFQVKSLFKDKTMHCEHAYKSQKANIRYCTKGESIKRFEFGQRIDEVKEHSFE